MDDSQAACFDMAAGESEAFVYRRRCDGRSPMNACAPSALSTKFRATFPIKRCSLLARLSTAMAMSSVTSSALPSADDIWRIRRQWRGVMHHATLR